MAIELGTIPTLKPKNLARSWVVVVLSIMRERRVRILLLFYAIWSNQPMGSHYGVRVIYVFSYLWKVGSSVSAKWPLAEILIKNQPPDLIRFNVRSGYIHTSWFKRYKIELLFNAYRLPILLVLPESCIFWVLMVSGQLDLPNRLGFHRVDPLSITMGQTGTTR